MLRPVSTTRTRKALRMDPACDELAGESYACLYDGVPSDWTLGLWTRGSVSSCAGRHGSGEPQTGLPAAVGYSKMAFNTYKPTLGNGGGVASNCHNRVGS